MTLPSPGGLPASGSLHRGVERIADRSRDVWTVPVGVGFGRVFHIGEQAIDLSVRPVDNVHRPDNGARWTFQILLKVLFPEGDA